MLVQILPVSYTARVLIQAVNISSDLPLQWAVLMCDLWHEAAHAIEMKVFVLVSPVMSSGSGP